MTEMNRSQRVAEIIGGEPGKAMLTAGLALVNERLDAEGLRGKVWMVMPYRCDRCELIQWYEAEVGVEGPPGWRADSTFIASAFVAGRCPNDGATMTHVMHADVEFEALRDPGEPFAPNRRIAIEFASKMFRVPREPVRYVTEGCDEEGNVMYEIATHAFLSTPMHAITRAMGASRRGF